MFDEIKIVVFSYFFIFLIASEIIKEIIEK
jgi:hypothetical protein